MTDDDRDVAARLTELEATVRGLTQELVSAEERIRQLEAVLEETETEDAGDDEPATKATPEEGKSESDAPPAEATEDGRGDLDDIIVA